MLTLNSISLVTETIVLKHVNERVKFIRPQVCLFKLPLKDELTDLQC